MDQSPPVDARGHDGFERLSLDIERSVTGREQKESLLHGFDRGDEDEIAPQAVPRRHNWSIWLFSCFATLLCSVIAASYFLVPSDKYLGTQPIAIATNDYVLEPEWDYSAPPQRREYTWTIRDRVHNPDGVYRPMILVNDEFPGPMIEVNEGDTIVVRVDNQASNATSIHWHGIFQLGSPHMDGTVGVTQCPIAPGNSYTYEFTVENQSGTYWWHGHQGLQSSDGLHGPLIIHGRDELSLQKISYDSDRAILLSDHYHDLSGALLWQYLMPDMENAEPAPESGLVNGRHVRNCDDYPNRHCDNSTTNVGQPSITLERNKSHRLRFINVGAIAEFSVQLDEHELAVTEADGTDVYPISYHRLNISPAQRYSVIVNTNNTVAESFWLRARMITSCFTDPPKTLQPDVFAMIKYGDDITTKPSSNDWAEQLAQECRDMNTTELVPVLETSTKVEPDAVFYIRSNFEIGAYRLSRGFFNSSSFRANVQRPTLQHSIDGLNNGLANFKPPSLSNGLSSSETPITAFANNRAFDPSSSLVVQTTKPQTIDLLISNFDDGTHPYHLHGYKFFILASGKGQPPLTHVAAEINRESLAPLYDTLDLSNPLRRDTTSVEAYGWVLLRFVTDNPGMWAFHCHLAWHAEAGLLMQFLSNTDELAQMEFPQSARNLCVAEGIEKGTGPKDEDYFGFAK